MLLHAVRKVVNDRANCRRRRLNDKSSVVVPREQ